MAPTLFSITLNNNPVGSYFPGETITGKVILVLEQEKNTQGLKLKFIGEAEVDWHESQSQGSKGFHEKESYFYSKIFLLGDEKNSDVTVPAGRHEYPFTFQLPENLPSSFESPFGHIRYVIEAIVKRSWKFDYTTKILFTVNALVDLNLQRVYMEPREALKEKSILCLCCKEGPISMKVQLPRTAYVPGEFIKFSVYSSNSSSRPVSSIVVYFIREIQYRAQGRSKSVCEEMMKLRGPEVQPFLSETWHEQFHIPPVPPTELGGCKLIELSYLLKFKLDIPSSIDLKKKLPIVLGTIPYTEFFKDLPYTIPLSDGFDKREEAQLPLTTSSICMPLPPSLFSQYPDLPTPVYQNAAKFDQEVENKGSNNKPSTSYIATSRAETPIPDEVENLFIPKYVTYSYGWKSNLNVPDQNGLN